MIKKNELFIEIKCIVDHKGPRNLNTIEYNAIFIRDVPRSIRKRKFFFRLLGTQISLTTKICNKQITNKIWDSQQIVR